jgi:hypothetical protein
MKTGIVPEGLWNTDCDRQSQLVNGRKDDITGTAQRPQLAPFLPVEWRIPSLTALLPLPTSDRLDEFDGGGSGAAVQVIPRH